MLTCFTWKRCWVVSPFILAKIWTKFFLSVALARKAKDKENAKSPLTASTQAYRPRDQGTRMPRVDPKGVLRP